MTIGLTVDRVGNERLDIIQIGDCSLVSPTAIFNVVVNELHLVDLPRLSCFTVGEGSLPLVSHVVLSSCTCFQF